MLKRLLTALVLVLLLAPSGFALEQSLLARVTVYWASGGGGSDRWTRQHICSTGARLRVGHCAVDPRRIPYGSRVTLPDATLIAVDTGAAVVSRKAARQLGRTAVEKNALVIDRFFETKQQALSWARRNPYFMPVKVSTPESGKIVAAPAEAPKHGLVASMQQQPISAPPQPSEGPRRSLDERPRLSSRYAR